MRVEIVDGVIPAAEIVDGLKAGSDGAVCVFDGIVRDNTRGRKTLHLDYEAYREMALEQMHGLAEEAVAKFGVRDVALVHRLGRLTVGETSVLVVVASAHRGVAFEACRWLIDTLKRTVPIWKKEQFVDGAIWADGEPFPEGIGVARHPGQPGNWPMASRFRKASALPERSRMRLTRSTSENWGCSRGLAAGGYDAGAGSDREAASDAANRTGRRSAATAGSSAGGTGSYDTRGVAAGEYCSECGRQEWGSRSAA